MSTSYKSLIVVILVSVLILNTLILRIAGLGGPVECKNSNDCIKAGLLNSYCRDEKHFFASVRHHSECEPKRG